MICVRLFYSFTKGFPLVLLQGLMVKIVGGDKKLWGTKRTPFPTVSYDFSEDFYFGILL